MQTSVYSHRRVDPQPFETDSPGQPVITVEKYDTRLDDVSQLRREQYDIVVMYFSSRVQTLGS